MSFLDTFKGNQYKAELETLQQKYDDLQQKHDDLHTLITPEMQNAFALQTKIRELENSVNNNKSILSGLDQTILNKREEIKSLDNVIHSKNSEIISLDDEIIVQEFGLYKPQFDFAKALDYKDKLTEIRKSPMTIDHFIPIKSQTLLFKKP